MTKKSRQKRCQRIITVGTSKNEIHERQCKNPAAPGSLYCARHSKENANIRIRTRYGRGSTYVYKLARRYAEKYRGKVWDATEEVAFLRAILQTVSEDLLHRPWFEVLDALPKITEIAGQITRIGERHAKIEDGLKLKIEFSQLQDFVSFMIGVINNNIQDDDVKAAIAEELENYTRRIEERND